MIVRRALRIPFAAVESWRRVGDGARAARGCTARADGEFRASRLVGAPRAARRSARRPKVWQRPRSPDRFWFQLLTGSGCIPPRLSTAGARCQPAKQRCVTSAHCLRMKSQIRVPTHRPDSYPSKTTPVPEENCAEKPPDLVARSALTGFIDHVDLAEHDIQGVTVDTGFGVRSRRHRSSVRKHT